MRKFSNQVKITESAEETFILKRKIGEFPEEYMLVMDMFTTYAESYSDDVLNCSIEKGYTNRMRNSVNSTNFKNIKNLTKMLREKELDDTVVPDKWKLGMKILISYKKLPYDENFGKTNLSNWEKESYNMFDINTIDTIINRYKAIKTLAERCKNYASEVKISYNTGIDNAKISLLVIF